MYKKIIKRLFDIIIGLLGSIFVCFLTILIAPLIYISDRGPVFYKSKRIGKDGKVFTMYKYRSMYVNAPDIRLDDGSTYNSKDDPRVTRIGRILRITSLDELPQLFNIVNGTMSLIGPRPDPPDWIEKYPEDIKVFLSVRPGITGYSQAYYRNSVDSIEKMKNDAYYALNCSFFLDVKIFFKTIFVVLNKDNTFKDTTDETKANIEIEKFKRD